MTTIIAALAVGAGLSVICVAVLLRARERLQDIASVLDLPFGEKDVEEHGHSLSFVSLVEPGIEFANKTLERLKVSERIRFELSRARIPLRPGEYVLITGAASTIGGAIRQRPSSPIPRRHDVRHDRRVGLVALVRDGQGRAAPQGL